MLVAGAMDAASERDINLLCFNVGHLHSALESTSCQVLCDLTGPESLDGVIVWSQGLDAFASASEMRDFLYARYVGRLPTVSIGLVEGVPSVTWDLTRGMRDMMAHLIGVHGCRRLACIRGPEAQEAANEIYQGYVLGLADHGIPFDPALVAPPGLWGPALGLAALHVLCDERRLQFDAIAGADEEAIAVIEGLERRGLRVPEDVVVTGFNDLDVARFSMPPLTTVQRPVSGAGRQAVAMLASLMAGEETPAQVLLPARPVARRSCGCVPESISRASVAAALPAGPVATPGLSFAAAFAPRREAVLARLAHELALLQGSGEAGLAGQLLERFLAEVNGDDAGVFLPGWERVLRSTMTRGRDVDAWQGVVSTLRSEMLPALASDERAKRRAENLWHQARVMTAETSEQAQTYRRLLTAEQGRTSREVSRSLIASFDTQTLVDSLARELPRLGIPSGYVSLYEDAGNPAGWSRLILAYGPGGRAALEPGGRRFPSRMLAPPGLLPPDRQITLIVEPLFFEGEQLGFAMFEVGPRYGELYETMSGQISSALKGALLAARNEELYREAVAARQAAEEANRLKSRFLSTVSHELRTPLTLIAGTIEMMLQMQGRPGEQPAARYRQDMECIGASAQHLSHLISDVLDLASSQAGELKLARGHVDLGQVLAEVALLGQPMALEKGLAWRAEIPAGLPPVWGDRTRLRQVALNLVSNAIKFTDHGEVMLSATYGGGAVTVEVSDTGLGIPPEEQEAIFDEFRQSERTAQRGYGGMGLGLAIARRLVELHGGRIGLRSSGEEGTGSTFFFTLPAMPDAPVAVESARSRAHAVLLLTERPGGGERLRRHLARRGYQVDVMAVAAGDGWLGRVLAAPPGAIVLDIEPAAERGWELIRALKENPATQDVPVLFYSLAAGDERGSLLALDYLSKPLGAEALAQVLERQGVSPDGARQPPAILLVDDDPCILDLNTRTVCARLPGCTVLQARDGLQALRLMERRRPDLVLLDLMMPEMDGFRVLEAMRERPASRDVPVIVLTAQSLTPDDMARLQHGVAAVLGKDLFTAEEVLAQVESTLARSKRLGSDAQRIVRRVMAYIHEHYAEPITREDLARHAALNERYLTRCFREESGMPPMTYLNRYRIRQAKALLEAGDQTVAEVALAVGFGDGNYFGRVFRQETGVTPGGYQRGERRNGSYGQ